jgi:hypothetical protein
MSSSNIFCINSTIQVCSPSQKKITRFMAGVNKGTSCKDHLTNLMYFLLTSEHLLYLMSFVVSHHGNISCRFRNAQYTHKIQISPPCASANHTT